MSRHVVSPIDGYQNVYNPHGARVIARDSTGRLWIVYCQGTPRAVYTEYSDDEGINWHQEMVGSSAVGDQLYPTLAVDSDDAVHFFWCGYGRGENDTVLQLVTRNWIAGSGFNSEELLTDVEGNQTYPAVAVGSADDIHLVWAGAGWGSADTYPNIQYMNKIGGVWGSGNVDHITDVGSAQMYSSIAVDVDNCVHITWNGFGFNEGTPHQLETVDTIQYIYNTGSGWSNIDCLTPMDGNLQGWGQWMPSIATDREGTIHVAFVGFGWSPSYNHLKIGILTKRIGESWPPGSAIWNTIDTIQDSGGNWSQYSYYPQIGVDESCNLHVTWMQLISKTYGEYGIAYAKRNRGGEWHEWSKNEQPFSLTSSDAVKIIAYFGSLGSYWFHDPAMLNAYYPRSSGISPNIPTIGAAIYFIGRDTSEGYQLEYYDTEREDAGALLFDAYFGFSDLVSATAGRSLSFYFFNAEIDVDYAHGSVDFMMDVEAGLGKWFWLLSEMAADPTTDFAFFPVYVGDVAYSEAEVSPPVLWPETYPINGQGGIGRYGPIYMRVHDLISGVDLNSIELSVGSVDYVYANPEVSAIPINPPWTYVIKFVPSSPWDVGSSIDVLLCIRDRDGNPGLEEIRI